MVNAIPKLQNAPLALNLLAAQRRAYGKAKRIMAIQIALIVVLPIPLVVLANAYTVFEPFAALIAISLTVLDVALFDSLKHKLRSLGASIQELFDTEILEIEWPLHKAPKPDPEDIACLSAGVDQSSLRDWYPPAVGQLPLEKARIICQRTNCRWDASLRRAFRVFLMLTPSIVIGVILFLGLARHMSLESFILSLLAPVMPLALWAIRESRYQNEAAQRSDRLKALFDDVWSSLMHDTVTSSELTTKSRLLQAAIFEHRKQSPMVFDWFYRLFRGKFESQMHYSTEIMINQARTPQPTNA